MSDQTRGDSTIERRRMLFTGRVQGVGFRYTTYIVAQRFDVVGFVRNLPDGSVECITEGVASELDRFQRAVESAMQEYIDGVTISQAEPTKEFTGFVIAR